MGNKLFVILWIFLATLHLRKAQLIRTNQICPNSRTQWTNLEGDFCYYLVQLKISSFDEALQSCVDMGGSLASIHSAAETDRLRVLYSSKRHEDSPYIGLRRLSNGELQWSDGTKVDYEKWSSGMLQTPVNNCTTMGYYTGNWYPVPCNTSASYICSTPKRIPCDGGTCKNGGYCSKDGINELFPCTCKFGFEGMTCSKRVTCYSKPCNNGGTCIHDENGVFRCTCQHGYTGAKCEEKIMCYEGVCKNGGSCSHERINGVFRCNCARGYKGLTCEETDVNILLIVLVCLGVLLVTVLLIASFFVVRRFRRQKAPDPKQLQSEYKKKNHDSLESCHMNILDEDEDDSHK